MSDEESGREEKFFHETLDRADIDVLRDPKVLTKFEKIDRDGIHTIMNADEVEFFDEDGNLRENLLIKWNNLIALYSLRQRLAGKVKLIYIDPPYNTGSDGFRYNDSFNHSTWLVFMRNRLEIARELLSDDGVIFISCDDREQAYLKVLWDEVFTRDNFVSNVIWEKKFSPQNDAKFFSDNHDFLLVFAKNKEVWKPFLLERTEEMNARYSNPDNDSRWNWTSSDLTVKTYNKEYDYPIQTPSWKIITPTSWRCWNTSKENFQKLVNDNRIWWWENQSNVPRLKRFLNEVQDGIVPLTIWKHSEVWHNQEAKQEIKSLFSEWLFTTPKPERLIKRILEISTKENDIIIDFCLGSWTTPAVAHKMWRRWIGIEQMDYIEDIAKVRLQKVIEGEQWGISKSVDWKWWGNFVYMELKTYNIEYLERIEWATTKEELQKVYVDMAHNAFLQFWFDRRDFEREGYKILSLEEQKIKLRELLDMNHLYLNALDMDDTRHRITPLERSLTTKFYGNQEI
jgi:adenine-specific DNA-methyltransferase